MNEVGNTHRAPQAQPPTQAHRQRETVEVNIERALQKQSGSRQVVSQSSRTIDSPGAQEQVTDSRHKVLYSRPAVSFQQTTDLVSQAMIYTQHASTISTTVSDRSSTMLDLHV